MSVPQRYSLVTLGVADVVAATAFYRAIGWRQSSASVSGEVTFFAMPGGVLALWSADALAADAGAPMGAGPGFRGVAVAINLASRHEVDVAIGQWVAAGGTVTRAAAATDWGGYSGYVIDRDGHAWEFAHNPFWPLDDREMPVLPGPDGE